MFNMATTVLFRNRVLYERVHFIPCRALLYVYEQMHLKSSFGTKPVTKERTALLGV